MPFVPRAVEVAKGRLRRLLADDVEQPGHPHGSAGFALLLVQRIEVEFRVDAQVFHLENVDPGAAAKIEQRLHLGLPVGDAGEDEIVELGVEPGPGRRPDRVLHLAETVGFWPVVGMVSAGDDAVRADADALEPRFGEPGKPLRAAAVGVEVKGAPIGPLADEAAGTLDDGGLKERLALAALPEAGHGLLRPLEVGAGDLGEFIGRGDELDPLVARREQLVGLKRDAAAAIGVAQRRDGQAHLPAPGKKILGREAVKLRGAPFEVGDQSVVGKSAFHFGQSAGKAPVVILLGRPARAVVHLDRRADEPAGLRVEAHRRVGPEG